MSSKPAAVVVGASSGVGRALAEALAAGGFRLVILAQDLRDLEAVGADLRVRFDTQVFPLAADLGDGSFDAEGFVASCLKTLGPIEAVFLVAGYVSEEDDALARDGELVRLVAVNYSSAVRLACAFGRVLEDQGRGRLVGFSSIAAASPRRRNMIYASAKAGFETYLGALRHYFAASEVLIQCYALGYVDTAMSYGRKLPPFMRVVTSREVARRVLLDGDRDFGKAFFPPYWRWIALALRLCPWPLYKRLSF